MDFLVLLPLGDLPYDPNNGEVDDEGAEDDVGRAGEDPKGGEGLSVGEDNPYGVTTTGGLGNDWPKSEHDPIHLGRLVVDSGGETLDSHSCGVAPLAATTIDRSTLLIGAASSPRLWRHTRRARPSHRTWENVAASLQPPRCRNADASPQTHLFLLFLPPPGQKKPTVTPTIRAAYIGMTPLLPVNVSTFFRSG
ncbi:hypothetical protein ACLOJK_003916 [Asimina triloba]